MGANIATAGGLMTGAGTAVASTSLPPMVLVGSTANRLELLEIAIENTTAVACVLALYRVTAAGTPGTALTPAQHDLADAAPTATLRGLYTVTPTTGADLGFRFSIPATIAAGVIRPFGPTGIIVPATAAAGIALYPIGTGQICNVDWTWAEL